jgi:hypothetical protein
MGETALSEKGDLELYAAQAAHRAFSRPENRLV